MCWPADQQGAREDAERDGRGVFVAAFEVGACNEDVVVRVLRTSLRHDCPRAVAWNISPSLGLGGQSRERT